MKVFRFVVAASFGIMAGIWLEDVGISVIGSINIAIPITYTWYKILEGIGE